MVHSNNNVTHSPPQREQPVPLAESQKSGLPLSRRSTQKCIWINGTGDILNQELGLNRKEGKAMVKKKNQPGRKGKAGPSVAPNPGGAQNIDMDQGLVLAYVTLRKFIGFLGAALPFLVYLGGLIVFQTGIQGSISDYYYTPMRDVFVGTLCAIGVFLFAYEGYARADMIAAKFAGLFAVSTALFPTAPAPRGAVHFVFATLFFATLIYFSGFLFTKTNTDLSQPPANSRKIQRNRAYRACAAIMFICIIVAGIYSLVPSFGASLPIGTYHPIFWLEAIADLAFGVSWAIKGEALGLLNDKAGT